MPGHGQQLHCRAWLSLGACMLSSPLLSRAWAKAVWAHSPHPSTHVIFPSNPQELMQGQGAAGGFQAAMLGMLGIDPAAAAADDATLTAGATTGGGRPAAAWHSGWCGRWLLLPAWRGIGERE